MELKEVPNKVPVYFDGRRILSHPRLGLPAKWQLLRAKLRSKFGLPCPPLQLAIGQAEVTVDLCRPADWYAFSEVVLNDEYAVSFTGLSVLDIGAHRGYFLAAAARDGAKRVYCYEPEKDNFTALSAVASSLVKSRTIVQVAKKAVSARSGTTTLHVFEDSWSHSLSARTDKNCLSKEEIETIALTEILAALRLDDPDARIAIKLDVEGGEGDIICSLRQEDTEGVELILFEYHEFCSTPVAAISSHLIELGFSEEERIKGPGSQHLLLKYRSTEAT